MSDDRNVPVIVRFYYPNDPVGNLICWRLESHYCHATIQIDKTIFSATFPKVIGVDISDSTHKNYTEVAFPPRKGAEYVIYVTEDEAKRATEYCQGEVGTYYDVLSALGWLFRWRALQTRRVYCFEYVYAALTAAGLFAQSKALVTGDELLVDLYHTGRLVDSRSVIDSQ